MFSYVKLIKVVQEVTTTEQPVPMPILFPMPIPFPMPTPLCSRLWQTPFNHFESTSADNDAQDSGEGNSNGKSTSVNNVTSNNTSMNNDNDNGNNNGNNNGNIYNSKGKKVKAIPRHILARLRYYFCLGGIIQRICEQRNLNVRRNRVVQGGASQFQDDRSRLGIAFHASHTVRVGEINLESGSEQYLEMARFMAHTNIIERWANLYSGIGGRIDDLQSAQANLDLLAAINFEGDLTEENTRIIIIIKDKFIDLLRKEIAKGELDEEKKRELELAIEAINNVPIKSLFESGKLGYSNKYKKE